MRLEAAFGEQRPDLLGKVLQQIGLELIIPAAQGRAQQLDALAQHLRQIQLRLATAHQTDQYPAAIDGQQLYVQRGIVTADGIEDHVKRCKVLQTVDAVTAYNTALGTQLNAVSQTLGRADADPDRVTECLAQLNAR